MKLISPTGSLTFIVKIHSPYQMFFFPSLSHKYFLQEENLKLIFRISVLSSRPIAPLDNIHRKEYYCIVRYKTKRVSTLL